VIKSYLLEGESGLKSIKYELIERFFPLLGKVSGSRDSFLEGTLGHFEDDFYFVDREDVGIATDPIEGIKTFHLNDIRVCFGLLHLSRI
jgi:hypothetical protein